jgi:divalent metal cation (Fe/Co/Zn/Cd) transporter
MSAFRLSPQVNEHYLQNRNLAELVTAIGLVALSAPGVSGVENTYARKTGLQYQMTVQDSHHLATATRFLIREKLDWVADVIVHIEPFAGGGKNP